MKIESIARRNFWIHILEGTLYISTGVLLSPQTVFPALVAKLGGDNVAIGCIPIIVYLTYFLPQILSANYIQSASLRKPWTIKLGILQRLQILFFAVVVGILGQRLPSLALIAFFLIYIANQIFAGLGSPIWFDLVAKTTSPGDRGKLMGIRTSLGALLGFLNSFLLTVLLAYLLFPLNFAGVFFLAFLLQFSSWLVQRKVVEVERSSVRPSVPMRGLVVRVKEILHNDPVYKKFLQSAGLLIIGLMPVGFFAVAAIKKFTLPESYVGLFTITMVTAQILSGALLGWLADIKGHKVSLLVCSLATACATILAIVSVSVYFYFAVFFFVGINIGAEMITRYNFAERCAPDNERPLYVGLMNAWLAPFYISATIGGLLSDMFGYTVVYVIGLIATIAGVFLLSGLPDPSRTRKASQELKSV